MRCTTELAKAQGCSHVILAGDLLDEKHGVRMECLDMLYKELQYSVRHNVTWVWLRGNHELSIKSQPHLTPMSLFQAVCNPIIEPAIWETPDAVLFFMPWYLAQEFIARAANMAATARTYQHKSKMLFAHIGLDEGKASPSNMYVEQEVALKHLHTEAYDLVWLGDYHGRQQLNSNTRYCGVPISLEHGDDIDNGVYLLDTALGTFQHIALPERFSRHKTWQVTDPNQSILRGYDSQDHNRIRLPREWIPTWQTLYPDAQFLSESAAPDRSLRRLAGSPDLANSVAPETIWRQFCQIKNQTSEILSLGLHTLGEVNSRRWATTK